MHTAETGSLSAAASPWEALRAPMSAPIRPWLIALVTLYLYAVAADVVLVVSALGGEAGRLRLGLAIALALAVAGRSLWVACAANRVRRDNV